MRTELIKGIVSIIITLVVVVMGGLSSPLESVTNTTSLLFSNKELIMIILIFIIFILKNIKLSMMIYSARKATGPYIFFFINNVAINLLLVLMLLETNKISLLVAGLLTVGEFVVATSLLVAGGFAHNVNFSVQHIRVKEFLGLFTIIILIIDGMPFALSSWPVASILTIIYVVYVLNLAFNNMYILTKEI